MTVSILSGSGRILSALNIMPQNLISLEPNFHFSRFSVSPALPIASITSWIPAMCCDIVLALLLNHHELNGFWICATLSSPWAGFMLIVRILCLYSLPLAWNTVTYLEESSNSICQKVNLKSIFEKRVQPASLDLISSCRGIDWLVGIINFCCTFTEITKVTHTFTFVAFVFSCYTAWFVFSYLSIDCISTVVARIAFILLDSIYITLFVLFILQLFKRIGSHPVYVFPIYLCSSSS